MSDLPNRIPIHTHLSPLRTGEGGAIRLGDSRVSLDLIVEQYENGMTPEEMVHAYDTLMLADVYAAIAYYLKHRDEVRRYLKQRKDEAASFQARIEAEYPRIGPDELLARRHARERVDFSPF